MCPRDRYEVSHYYLCLLDWVCLDFADTFNALGYDASIAIIPYENSIHGAVTETLDLLQSPRFPSELAVSETVELAINHCLMVKNGASLQDITSVYSHEQVRMRCRSRILVVYHEASRR
jgi:prephenate dehydratase